MTAWTVTRTGWDGARLVIEAMDLDGTVHRLPWNVDQAFHWQVGDMVHPPQTPTYVFEPRPLDAVRDDLDRATTDAERQRVEAELRLCDRPHAVYIAFYGTLPKVGMTSADRLPLRLREQGADAGFAVAVTPDRATARDLENAISFRHRIPQWRTAKERLPQWTRPVDMERITRRADDLRRRLGSDHEPGPLLRIDDHPLPVLSERPALARPTGHHAGTIVGAKGTHIVYCSSAQEGRLDVGHGHLVAVKHTDLVGRTITSTPV